MGNVSHIIDAEAVEWSRDTAVASQARLAQAVKIDPAATVEAGEGSQAESTVPVANTTAENDVKAADSQLDNTASAANADNSLNRNA